MTKAEFLKLMNPNEWELFSMYPDKLSQSQVCRYQVRHEDTSGHDRNIRRKAAFDSELRTLESPLQARR